MAARKRVPRRFGLCMELLVAVILVLGLVAIAIRFGLRGPAGSVQLPRIVDDSIGMWVLRRATGRPLLGRAAGDRPDPFSRFRRPSTVLATRVPPPRPGRSRPRSRPAPVETRAPAATSTATPTGATDADRPVPDSWQVIPRRPAGRTFGSSILPTAEPDATRRPARTTAVLGYVGLAIVIAAIAFVAGAALGVVATPGVPRESIGPSTGTSGSAGSTGSAGVLGSPRATIRVSTRPEPVPTRQP